MRQEKRPPVSVSISLSIVEAVYQHAINTPDKICLIEGDTEISYEEFFRYSFGFAKYLRNMGLSSGDYVVVVTTQTIAFFATALAIQMAGAVFVPLETAVSNAYLNEILELTSAKILITKNPDSGSVSKSDSTSQTVLLSDDVFGHKYTGEITGSLEGTFGFPNPEDLAEVLFTTGTTGKSKGVMQNHASLVAVANNVRHGVQMLPNNIEIIPGPYNHSNPLRRYYANMLNGSTIVCIDGVVFVQRFIEAIEKHRVTAIALVPTFVKILLQLAKNNLSSFDSQLDYIQVGGSMFSKTDKMKLAELMPSTRLYDFYGSTEAGCSCILDFANNREKLDTIGLPTVNSLFRFVDDDGKEVAASADNPAYLVCGGAMVMSGYFADEPLTKETLIDGYVFSKDLAYPDEDGYIHVLGRKSDVINMGGNKISPKELEDIVLAHPNIIECACVGFADKLFGEVPKLFVVFNINSDAAMSEFKSWLELNVDGSKMPRSIDILDALPKTYNGKIDKEVLKEV
jgi:acyl-coenzyme A synthetase/AMP-(fatty) acid ligase